MTTVVSSPMAQFMSECTDKMGSVYDSMCSSCVKTFNKIENGPLKERITKVCELIKQYPMLLTSSLLLFHTICLVRSHSFFWGLGLMMGLSGSSSHVPERLQFESLQDHSLLPHGDAGDYSLEKFLSISILFHLIMSMIRPQSSFPGLVILQGVVIGNAIFHHAKDLQRTTFDHADDEGPY